LIRVKMTASIVSIEIPMTGGRAKQEEDVMPRYVVRFVKDVLGENGRQAEICQSSMEIDADSKVDAAELAKKCFCGSERLPDWSLHADRIQIMDAEFPS
jgi:hypothetical protein